ncbi:MAG: DUF4870 domain-containing protein [Actinomycetota bacterium]|nr:DUF4870 domain-containing protein [Actinomycetota bacterium]
MKPEAANYGIQREYEARSTAPPPVVGAMSAGDERAWSALAHLSTFLNVFTGFLGPVAAFVIWLVYKDRSPAVASHAMRSVFYQLAWLSAILVGWTVTIALMTVLIGFLLVPVMIPVTLAPFVQASYEAWRAYQGGGRHHYL